jgi:VWFA-related protein
MTRSAALALACILWAIPATHSLAQIPSPSGLAQGPASDALAPPAASAAQVSTLTARSTLVIVPALVRNKARQLVFTLKADDFVLTDDGVPQKLMLEQDTGGEPLALVVDIEGGGAGVDELDKYRALAPMLGAVVGGVPHKIAVVGFDSSPVLVEDFTPNTNAAEHAIQELIADDSGDNGAAILDSIGFAVDLLRKQPAEYRRAILLVSETNDYGSKLRLDDALREIGDTNTVIYSFGFSSSRDELVNGSAKALADPTPGPAHGCMSRDPNDPNVNLKENPAEQAYGCLELLVPPLALARAAAIAFIAALQKNIPETVARLTGGEYFKLGNQKSLERNLQTISNHIPNRYVLSFQPQAPHAGFHAIELRAPEYPGLTIAARNGYWAESEAPPANPSPAPK